jgi:hypothetical protein
MATYSELPKAVNSAQRPVRRLTGQYLARAHLSRPQRAELAAALAEGSAEVFPLTAKQAAMLAAVPIVAVTKARRANGSGSGNGHDKPKCNSETLAEHIARSSLAERIEAARTVGVDTVWDSMIAPVIATERAAPAE